MNIELLSAEIAQRVPELARDSVTNRAEIIKGIIRAEQERLADNMTETANRRALNTAKDEIQHLRGIIARNAMQRLEGDESKPAHVTAQDIKDSLECLYEYQRVWGIWKTANTELKDTINQKEQEFYG